MNEMKKIIARRSDIMIEKYNIAKEVNFPEEKIIKIKNIQDYSTFNEDFANLGKNIIYLIMTNELPFTYEKIKKTFDDLKKKSKKYYHVSKINDKQLWERKNKILYVGSKEDEVQKRFQQHLGIDINTRSAYSLYLKDWWPNNVEIIIKIYQFDTEINADILQIIEDLLWDEYLPLFGKKGATFNKKMKLMGTFKATTEDGRKYSYQIDQSGNTIGYNVYTDPITAPIESILKLITGEILKKIYLAGKEFQSLKQCNLTKEELIGKYFDRD
jgi:hypothetical protein